jgi:tetratricopeptide (TPR) repeat protein
VTADGEAPEGEIDRLRRKANARPSKARLWVALAMALEASDPQGALDACRRVAGSGPRDGLLDEKLGELLWRLGRREEAIGHLQAAAEASPLRIKRWKRLAEALQETGDAHAAARALRRGQVLAAEREAGEHLTALGFELDAARAGRAEPGTSGGPAFDPARRFPVVRKEQVLTRVGTPGALQGPGDAYYVVDEGERPLELDPVISLKADGSDVIPIDGEYCQTCETFVAALDDARVVGRGAVITREGKVIWDLLKQDLAKHAARMEDGAFAFDPVHYLDGHCSVRRFDGPAVLLAAPTDLSFGDWINNFPTRLALVEAAGLDLPYLVNRRLPGKFIEMLLALGVRRDRLWFHDPDGVSIVPRLYTPSWPLPDRLKPMQGIYDIYQRMAATPRAGKRPLLYLSRQGIGNRALLNEAEVRDLFASKGFQIVYPEQLDLQETLELFAAPACVAGPYGSAIRNLVFCRKKPISLMVMPPYPASFLTGVAVWFGGVGSPFAYVTGTNAAAGPEARDPNTARWTASLADVERAIEAILARLRDEG